MKAERFPGRCDAGRVVTHKQILSAIWGPAHTEHTQYLRIYIGHLRREIEDARPSNLFQLEILQCAFPFMRGLSG